MKNKGKLRLLALTLAVATMFQTGLQGNAVYAVAEGFGAHAVTESVGEWQGGSRPYALARTDAADSGILSPEHPMESFALDSGLLDSGMLRELAPGPFLYFSDVKATSNVKVPGSENEYQPLDPSMARDGIFRVEYRFQLPAATPPDASLNAVTPGIPYTFLLPNKLKVAKNFTIAVNDVTTNLLMATVRVPSAPSKPNEGSITFTPHGAVWGAEGAFELELQMDGSKIGNTGSETFHFTVGADMLLPITVPFTKATPEIKITPQKTVASIDKAARTVNWKITLKPTGLYKPPAAGVACAIPLQNVVVTDTFFAASGTAPGQTLVAGSVKLNGGVYTDEPATVVPVNDGAAWDIGFHATLPTLTTGTEYVLTYQTKFDISSANIFNPANGKLTVKNDALVNYKYQEFGDNGNLISGTQESTDASANETLTFIEKSGTHTRNAAKGHITWTVTFNQSEVEVDNPVITDALPENLKLRESPDSSVFLYEGDAATGTMLTSGDGTGNTYQLTTNAGGSQTLTHQLGAATDKKWKLVYITDVDESVYTGTETFDAKNSATFSGDGIRFTKTATVGVVAAGHMVNKTSSYNPADHIITWNIAVNSVKAEIASGTTLTDTLPAGVTYVPGSLTVMGQQPTAKTEPDGTASGGELKLKWDFSGGKTTDTINVSFKTRVDDVAVWAKNDDTKAYQNTATLMVGLTKYISEHTPTITSTVLEKKSLGYVQNGPDGAPIRQITWQLDVNKNGMTMRDVAVTDTIHKDLEFVRAYFVDASGTELAPPAGAVLPTAPLPRNPDGTQSAVIRLNNAFSDYKHIRVVTRVRPELEAEFNKNPDAPWKVTNEAALTGEAKHYDDVWSTAPNISVAPVEQQITSSVVKKYGEYDPNKYGYDGVGWSVDINRNSAALGTVVLEDDTNASGSAPYLFLNVNSVKLYEMTVVGDGSDRTKDVKGALVDKSKYTVEYNEAASPHQFTITIPNVTRAYRLEYVTDIAGVPDGKVTFENTMKLKGTTTGEASKSESSLSASFGSGSGSGSLAGFAGVLVRKTDTNGTPLAGAEFELRSKAEPTRVYKLTTNSAGEASLNTVRATAAGTGYTLTETKAPSGYALPVAAPQEVVLKKGGTAAAATFVVADPQILGTLTVTKSDKIDGNVLSGAEFTLTKAGDASATIVKTTDADGKAVFTGLTIGDYTVTETAPPAGYEADAGNTYSFTVLDDQTREIQTFSKAFQNEKLPGTLTVHKKDAESGVPVPGAEFTLYLGDAALETAVSGADGRAVFGFRLRDGQTYSVRETKAPQGYVADAAVQSVTVRGSTQQMSLTFHNKRILGTLLVTKQNAVGTALAGAEIGLYLNNAEETLVSTVTTGEDGLARFEKLTAGSYFYRELQAPRGYRLDTSKHPFTITEDGQLVSEVLINRAQSSGGGGGGGGTQGTPPPTPPEPEPETPSEKPPVQASGKVDIPEGDSVVLGTPPKNGNVVLNADGTWSYKGNAGGGAPDSFTVILHHADGTTEIVLVQINDEKVPTSALPNSGGSGLTRATVFGLALVLCGAVLRGRKKGEENK